MLVLGRGPGAEALIRGGVAHRVDQPGGGQRVQGAIDGGQADLLATVQHLLVQGLGGGVKSASSVRAARTALRCRVRSPSVAVPGAFAVAGVAVGMERVSA